MLLQEPARPASAQPEPCANWTGTVKSSWYRRMTRSTPAVCFTNDLGGERDAEGISFIPPGFFKQNNITWYPGKAMVRLDCAERRILLDDGTFLPYDRLLLATGAYYLLPPVPGLKEAENVYGFRDLSDAWPLTSRKPGPGQ